MPTLVDVLSESGALAVGGDPATATAPAAEAFDRLARLAATLLGAPVAAITIVGPGRPRLVGVAGADRAELERGDHVGSIGLCAQVIADGGPIYVEDRRRHPELPALWRAPDPALVAYAGVPLLDAGGAPLGALAVADRRPRGWPEGERAMLAELAPVVVAEIERRVDRVRHARATAALQRSELSLRVLYEQVAIGIGVADAEGRFLQANPFLCEMLGYAEEELRTLTREDVTHPDERGEMERRDARLLSGELRSYHVEKRFVRKDGAVVWGRAKVSVTRDDALAPRRFITLIEDVTERKHAEAERRQAVRRLKVSEELHRSLFDHHPDAVMLLDTAGRFVKANPACEATIGYPPGEIVGRRFDVLVMPEDLEEAEAHYRAALAGVAQTFEMPLRHRDGHRVEASVTSIPVMVGDEVIGVFGIARDLAAQRALEAKLLHAQKVEVVGRLAGGVAHDFNNVLTIIQSYAELLRAELPAGSAPREDVAEILRATGRGTALTRQLLAVGRRQAPMPRLLDLNEQLTGLAGMLRRLLGAHVTLQTRLAEDLWPVRMDAGQLEQVLINLVVNARDAMPDGGVITLRTYNVEALGAPGTAEEGAAPEDHVALVVEDTGVGIPPEVLPRLFEPFFTTKEPGKGTGLGLPTVFGVVEQSGGRVSVESEPGQGTRFTVHLPRAVDEPGAGAASVGAAAPEALPRGSETVLLVEDEGAVRAALHRLLARQGYMVLEAADGEEALEIWRARGRDVDLVLTDLAMPRLGGLALAGRLRAMRPELPVVLMTAYAGEAADSRAELPPGAPLLQKPVRSDALLRTLRDVLEGRTG